MPAGGAAGAITIGESLILTLTSACAACEGTEESLAVTVIEYVPAVTGVPDNCPEVLSVSPGGVV